MNTVTCYDMNEPRKHYAKQMKKEARDKGCILYASIYKKCLEWANS